jgi:hypothetical protein
MPAVSVTRLRVRSLFLMPQFLWHTLRSQRQLKGSPGLLGSTLANAPGRAFWTATVWEDEAAIKRFRDSGAHRQAMPKLLDMCDEASLARWTQDSAELPSAAVMLERLQTIGRTSKVRHPSAGHRAGQTVPDGRAPRRGAPAK